LNPFLLAASPVARNAEMIMRAFDKGWAGAVTKSLALSQNNDLHSIMPRFSGFGQSSMGNIDFRIDKTVEETVKDWSQIKAAYPDHFLAVSIKEGVDEKTWRLLTEYAASTGADAIELCLSCPDSASNEECVAIGQNPDSTGIVINWVKKQTDLPIIVKLTPAINNILPVARAVIQAGANAATSANTLKSITGVNLSTLVPEPTVAGYSNYVGLSGEALKPLTLRVIAEIAGSGFGKLELSGAGGIRNWRDAAEYILLGASTTQVATEVMFRGYDIITEFKDGLAEFMDLNQFSSVQAMVGYSLSKLKPTYTLDQNYRVVAKYNDFICIGCGRCYVSCRDGAYQAIDFNSESRRPHFREEDCHGCGLCLLVCPVKGCIVMEESTVPFPKKNKEIAQ
jgi:dihydropyrimidine dehydrogenase (NAD+) subunit PreA